MDEANNLKALVDAAHKILIITHISPDPDALCSLLLVGTTLKENFPDKGIVMSSEELSGDLDFLSGYQEIEIQPLSEAIEKSRPELIIMVDAMNFSRCSREPAEAASDRVRKDSIKLVIIDHHEPENVETNELYINNASPAATQDVYQVLFHELGLKKPAGYAQTALLGIISDTNRFMYDNPGHKRTFDVVDELLDAGASIEKLEYQLRRLTKNQMLVLAELAANLMIENGYSYSFISDEFKDGWLNSGKSPDDLKLGCEVFVGEYIRNIEANMWGFIVYPDFLAGQDHYSVSFRSESGARDVSKIAKKLGGGGHKPAAGAKFKSESVEAALDKVKTAINKEL